jgi:hypothetical protein
MDPYGEYEPRYVAEPPPSYFTPQPPGYGHQPPAPVRVSAPLLGWLLIVAAVLTALGAVLPWASFFGLAITGTAAGDGDYAIAAAVLVAVCGLVIGVGQGRLWTSACSLVAGLLICLIAIVDVVDVNHFATSRDLPPDLVDVSVGSGLWLTLVAGLLVTGLSAVAVVYRAVLTPPPHGM